MYVYLKKKKTITHIHSENKYIHIKYWDTKKTIFFLDIYKISTVRVTL